MRLLFLAGALASSVIAERAADACSSSPSGALLLRDGATVPANLPGIEWVPSRCTVDEPDLTTLTLVDAAAPSIPLAIELVPLPLASETAAQRYLVVPKARLVDGKRYVIADATTCIGQARTATFTAGPAAPLPTSLGEIRVSASAMATLAVAHDASCSFEVEANRAELEIALSAEAMPWRDVLQFETLADGASWSAKTSLVPRPTNRGTDVVYRTCAAVKAENQEGFARSGLDAGRHQVAFRATIAGTGVRMLASPVPVSLACSDEAELVNDDGGCATTRGGASWLLVGLGALLLRARRRR